MADLGKQGKSKPSGGTAITGPVRDHGLPKGGSPAASGMFGPTNPVQPAGKGNNDKRKAK